MIVESESKTITSGDSKLGGTPDLPLSINWPQYEDKSMLFLGQVNLYEISEFHQTQYLPKSGILYFFAYFQTPESIYGTEYEFLKRKEEYSVIYFDGSVSELK
jgi:uncharacterized protein YwqG